MASPSTVISRGYGTWGTVNLLPTRGYSSSTVTATLPKVFDFLDVPYTQVDTLDVPYTQADFLNVPYTQTDFLGVP